MQTSLADGAALTLLSDSSDRSLTFESWPGRSSLVVWMSLGWTSLPAEFHTGLPASPEVSRYHSKNNRSTFCLYTLLTNDKTGTRHIETRRASVGHAGIQNSNPGRPGKVNA